MTEGVDQTEGSGGAGFYQDYYANSEISVSAAGQDVTTNTPGALVLVTVKSGGNQFKGLFNQTYEGRDFVGNNIDEETAARGFTGQPNLSYAKPTATSADRSGATSCGSSSRAITSASTRRSPACPNPSPPTSASSTTSPPRKPGSRASNNTFIALLPASAQAAAQARVVGHDRAGIDAGAEQLRVDGQRPLAARVEQSPVQRGQRRPVGLQLPAAADDRLPGQPAANRRDHRASTPARAPARRPPIRASRRCSPPPATTCRPIAAAVTT